MSPPMWPSKLDGLIVRKLRSGAPLDLLRLAREIKTAGLGARDIHDRILFLFGPLAIREGRIHPLEQALALLGPRAAEDGDTVGGFRLDRRPAAAQNIIAEARRVQGRLGIAPMAYPGPDSGTAP